MSNQPEFKPTPEQERILAEINKRIQAFDKLTELYNCARCLVGGLTINYGMQELSFDVEEMCFKLINLNPDPIPNSWPLPISNNEVLHFLHKAGRSFKTTPTLEASIKNAKSNFFTSQSPSDSE